MVAAPLAHCSAPIAARCVYAERPYRFPLLAGMAPFIACFEPSKIFRKRQFQSSCSGFCCTFFAAHARDQRYVVSVR